MSSHPTIVVSCSCGRTFQAPMSAAGRRARCPGCDRAVRVPIPSLDTAEVDSSSPELWPIPPGEPSALAVSPAAATEAEAEEQANSPVRGASPGPLNLREYKVLSRLHEWFTTDGFRPDELELALNTYAAQGWSLHSILSVRVGESRTEEVIAILERPA